MTAPILATKLYIPPPQPKVVLRSRLIERLNEGLHRKLTLISASAGFGKTTLVSEWVAGCGRPVAWLSLDEGDSDPARFLSHLIVALQTVVPDIGSGALRALQSPQPPSTESLLTSLLNEVASVPDDFGLVLDDYHVIDARPIDSALAFLLEHQPPQMHLVIATREDPHLPLARLRVRGQLNELRAADLRFTPDEAAEFLNKAMGLNLSPQDIATLETRTEGWIAGLQLAAISMQGRADTSSFIASFTGSHRFVLDYLVEEVLQQQSEYVQAFLLNTSILERMCGPLCDALLQDGSASGRQTLEQLEHANLFIVPLDSERDWYRYHHLFAELLRQRLRQRANDNSPGIPELNVRASAWFEENGLEIEALQHAIAANDVERAERLIVGNGAPLYVRGAAWPVLNWLKSLPVATLDTRPALWIMLATVLSIVGQLGRVEETLLAAEAAMQSATPESDTHDLIGRIADLRALVALLAGNPRQIESIIAQTRHALEHQSPANLNLRASATWKLGLAYQYRGDRVEARQVHAEAIAICEATGNTHVNIMATTCLGRLQEDDNQTRQAADTFRRVLQLVGDPPGPVACEAHAGLARTYYEWNDVVTAQQHAEQSLELARQVEIASFVTSELILARLQLARGDVSGAIASLAGTAQAAQAKRFSFRLPEVVAVQVFALLRQGHIEQAEQLAGTHDLPLSWARVQLARGDNSAALETLESYRQQVEARAWHDERFKVMQLQALALHALGDTKTALQVLGETLAMAEPEGFIRAYVDEGPAMAELLSQAAVHGIAPEYVNRLLAAFTAEGSEPVVTHALLARPSIQTLAEPLSQRELEILRLIANGLSNREIGERLFLALATVKGHNRNIFGKLQVQRRTEAVARARELGLL